MRAPIEHPDNFDEHGRRIEYDPDYGHPYVVDTPGGRSGAWVALLLVAAILCLLSALGGK